MIIKVFFRLLKLIFTLVQIGTIGRLNGPSLWVVKESLSQLHFIDYSGLAWFKMPIKDITNEEKSNMYMVGRKPMEIRRISENERGQSEPRQSSMEIKIHKCGIITFSLPPRLWKFHKCPPSSLCNKESLISLVTATYQSVLPLNYYNNLLAEHIINKEDLSKKKKS